MRGEKKRKKGKGRTHLWEANYYRYNFLQSTNGRGGGGQMPLLIKNRKGEKKGGRGAQSILMGQGLHKGAGEKKRGGMMIKGGRLSTLNVGGGGRTNSFPTLFQGGGTKKKKRGV